ncbi:RNA methyltransferase [Chryseobacterium sp. SNU WT5]|uniref:TrmH family RNA methyltransferase n=1 Tax=Chryseobacterium sp. SNU WT5 TaxID=2594269 RepID=UPI00117E069F|nr:RNA methyltransferase [Chryseobacterium sp. SNU WT5]QDP84855.1 RNA methyltransferase [Chryseobacterium sp. SNU WT5]
MLIESLQNEKIKYVTRLITDNRFRKREHVFVVEGKQENERALRFGFEPVEYFIEEEIFNDKQPNGKVHFVSAKVYDKLAYRGSSEGIIAIYKTKFNDLKDFEPTKNSSIIILEGVEKPGNLGAILRSCEAFGIEALIVTDSKVDFFNPNVIRSSVGCLFGMNIFISDNPEIYKFLQQHNFHIYTTIMDKGSVDIQSQNLTEKSAVLFGTEHSGLTDYWVGKGKNTLIPMAGSIDSLNLSNAVAISCYEMLRQKMA